MSDVEYSSADDGDDEEAQGEQAEENLIRLRTLAQLVRSLPSLYDKTLKEYCGKKNFNTVEAWETIGQALEPGTYVFART